MIARTRSLPPIAQESAERLVRFLESSGADTPEATFAPQVFSDLTLPHWRVQVMGADAIVATRQQMHPQPGTVRVEQVLGDEHCYSVKLEERWQDGGQEWYCREGCICVLDDQGRIEDFTLYCTGDWSEELVRQHAASVTLLRP